MTEIKNKNKPICNISFAQIINDHVNKHTVELSGIYFRLF